MKKSWQKDCVKFCGRLFQGKEFLVLNYLDWSWTAFIDCAVIFGGGAEKALS
jgi:hypothetical protein